MDSIGFHSTFASYKNTPHTIWNLLLNISWQMFFYSNCMFKIVSSCVCYLQECNKSLLTRDTFTFKLRMACLCVGMQTLCLSWTPLIHATCYRDEVCDMSLHLPVSDCVLLKRAYSRNDCHLSRWWRFGWNNKCKQMQHNTHGISGVS